MSVKLGETPVRKAMLDPLFGGRGWAEDPGEVIFLAKLFFESACPGKLVLWLDGTANVTVERKGSSLFWETTDERRLRVTSALMRSGGLLYEGTHDEAIAAAARIFAMRMSDGDATFILVCKEHDTTECVIKRFGGAIRV